VKSCISGVWTGRDCAALVVGRRENIASGNLVHVLPEYYQPANVWAVYVSRLATSAKIRTTVEFLRHYFQQHYPQHDARTDGSAVGRGD
jgi:LysR family transcriptional activator of dmlA